MWEKCSGEASGWLKRLTVWLIRFNFPAYTMRRTVKAAVSGLADRYRSSFHGFGYHAALGCLATLLFACTADNNHSGEFAIRRKMRWALSTVLQNALDALAWNCNSWKSSTVEQKVRKPSEEVAPSTLAQRNQEMYATSWLFQIRVCLLTTIGFFRLVLCYMLARYFLSSRVCPFIRLSVCLSQVGVCTKTAKHRITQTALRDSPWTLVLLCQRSSRNFDGLPPTSA